MQSKLPNPDSAYIDCVTELGETHEVVTSEPILSEQGVKLLQAGERVDRAMYERLVRHKLLRPIDECLSVAGGVDVAIAVRAARKILDSDERIQGLLGTLRDPRTGLKFLARVDLTAPLALKLTVLHAQRRERFLHAVRVALIAIYLGARLRLPEDELEVLAAAGLFHDLGELHIDRVWLDQPLSSPEAVRQIHSHPAIAFLFLEYCPQYDPRIRRAVLEHHERLDGSGYPKGSSGEDVSRCGRILALAEVVGSLYDRASEHICSDLTTILKANPDKYDVPAVREIMSGLSERGIPSYEVAQVEAHSIGERFGLLSRLINDLPASQDLAESPLAEVWPVLERQVDGIVRALRRTGLPLDESGASLTALLEDADARTELASIIREMSYQLELATRSVKARLNEEQVDPRASAWLSRVAELQRAGAAQASKPEPNSVGAEAEPRLAAPSDESRV